MTRIPKIVALLAFGMAAGCRDSYPNQQPPANVLYYPVGLAVRQMPPVPGTPGKEFGWSQLAVVNSNFDLRYDEQTGGTVLVVDPDASQDQTLGGELAVLGSMGVGSFGGEVALLDAGCQPGWPDCPSACGTLAADPVVQAGGARLVTASRSAQVIYRMGMAADGSLTCGDGCGYPLPIERLDPYGLSTTCGTKGGAPVAYVFVSHLQAANNIGWLTRMNLLVGDDVVGLVLGDNSTYTSVYNAADDLLFITSSVAVNAQFRWFNPFVTVSDVNGFAVPDYSGQLFGTFLAGAVARDMALSRDGRLLYVTVQLYDLTLAAQTGLFFSQGGALAVFDLSPTAFAEPRMALLGLERTCLGAGQIRRLPARSGVGKPELFAITCDVEGALALYDADAGRVVKYVGLDTTTGLPLLGLSPFGLAVEPVDPRRATVPVAGYDASPCTVGKDCQRIYVASFLENWVNVLELDPDEPTAITLVKRIGRGP